MQEERQRHGVKGKARTK